MTKSLEIMVRSRVKHGGEWLTEWTETVHSWKAAWHVVEDAAGTKDETRAWTPDEKVTNKRNGFWFLDIGGTDERAEQAVYFREELGIDLEENPITKPEQYETIIRSAARTAIDVWLDRREVVKSKERREWHEVLESKAVEDFAVMMDRIEEEVGVDRLFDYITERLSDVVSTVKVPVAALLGRAIGFVAVGVVPVLLRFPRRARTPEVVDGLETLGFAESIIQADMAQRGSWSAKPEEAEPLDDLLGDADSVRVRTMVDEWPRIVLAEAIVPFPDDVGIPVFDPSEGFDLFLEGEE